MSRLFEDETDVAGLESVPWNRISYKIMGMRLDLWDLVVCFRNFGGCRLGCD